MKKLFLKLLLVLSYGSGLTGGKPLLWWHPMVWVFLSVVIFMEMLHAIKAFGVNTYQAIKNNNWRTRP